LREVQRRARRAQLIVEMVDGRVFLFADVTVLLFMAFGTPDPGSGIRDPGSVVPFVTVMNVMCDEAICNRPRREDVGCVKDRLAPKRADTGLLQHALIATHARCLALP